MRFRGIIVIVAARCRIAWKPNGFTPAPQPEQPKEKRPPLNERLAKIAKRKAALEKAEARLTAEARKVRTGQLIAWGLWVEYYYKVGPETDRQNIERLVYTYLKDRNLARAHEGFAQLDAEIAEKAAAKAKAG